MLVDWERVQQVTLPIDAGSLPACPICLDPPTAPKITKCGHIYCFHCILHYLAIGEKTYVSPTYRVVATVLSSGACVDVCTAGGNGAPCARNLCILSL